VTDEGKASLSDLFQGRSQLLIYHLVLGRLGLVGIAEDFGSVPNARNDQVNEHNGIDDHFV
jgi:predicted dithiol-disulfide oxidoreductase (DUF899 family)